LTGTWLAWALNAQKTSEKSKNPMKFPLSAPILAAVGASYLTRVSGQLAFRDCQRATLTTDVIAKLGETMQRKFPVDVEQALKSRAHASL